MEKIQNLRPAHTREQIFIAAGKPKDLVRKHRSDDERGASAVEYGLLVALIAVIIIVAVSALGTKLSGVFRKTSASLPS